MYKILHVIPTISLKMGGPTVALMNQLEDHENGPFHHEVVCTNDDVDGLLSVPLGRFINYKKMRVRFFRRFKYRVGDYLFSYELMQWLNMNIINYDLIHCHYIFTFTSDYAANLARSRKVPYVISVMGQLNTWSLKQKALKKKLYLEAIARRNLIHASAVHCASDLESEDVNLFDKRIQTKVVLLGVRPVKLFLNKKNQSKPQLTTKKNSHTLLFMGRIDPKKRPELIISSLQYIDKKTVLILAGGGDPAYIRSLKILSKQIGVDRRVSFLGHLHGDELKSVMSLSSLFILPSSSENFGLAVAEAMMVGLPVIISPHVYISRIIRREKAGVVTPLNSKSIARAIQFAFRDEDRLLQMSKNAEKCAKKHFLMHNFSKNMNHLYRMILSST